MYIKYGGPHLTHAFGSYLTLHGFASHLTSKSTEYTHKEEV